MNICTAFTIQASPPSRVAAISLCFFAYFCSAAIGWGQTPVVGEIQIEVVTGSGAPVQRADLAVVNADGKGVWFGEVRYGSATIKDLPFGEHTLILNRNRCVETRVGAIRFSFLERQLVRIIQNDCPGTHFSLRGGDGCRIELRVRDKAQQPVEGAQIIRPGAAVATTDGWGRAGFTMKKGTTLIDIQTAKAKGQLTLHCHTFEDHQETVTLTQ